MSFKEFASNLKENKIKNVCLLWGREQFLTEWAENEIIKAYSNEVSRQFDVAEFDGAEADIHVILEACETLPLFSEKKLVIVDKLPFIEGKKSAADEAALTAYIKNPAETTLLVLTCGEKVDKRLSIYKNISKNGSVYEFGSLEPKELRSWIKKRFRTYKKTVSDANINLLVELSGYYDRDSEYTLYHFENDISKVILHSEGAEIKSEDIEKSVSGSLGRNVFSLIDCIASGDKKKALQMLDDMLLYDDYEMLIITLLFRQYENVLKVKQLIGEGRSRSETARILGAKDFLVGKWQSIGRKYSEEELKNIVRKIYEGDKMSKLGNIDVRLFMELFIASV
ncbi:MAG: DNA polymerase III subunit delta [Bacillota bacterium]|nr:DNA polymerase III subunit delta [Bacillota bacterium]